MRYFAIGLAAMMAMVACRTHDGDPCDPECGVYEQSRFAECVANGMPAMDDDPACPAGNRMCCALNQHCLGELDDQTVATELTCDLEIVTIEYCAGECDADHEDHYDECVASNGFEMCTTGDVERCCAETIGCLGELGGFRIVSSADCCEDDLDCEDGQYCDPEYGECDFLSDSCGDFIVDDGEDCDEGATGSPNLRCVYGEESCLRCTDTCRHVDGEAHYCGDELLEVGEGEECDPPGPTCTSGCLPLDPTTCGNGRMDNDETDVDCGGPSCDPCFTGDDCELDRDCAALSGLCPVIPSCDLSDFVCVELDACDDGDECTRDFCQAATAGCAFEVIDDDFDDFGPGPACGGDCDDGDRDIFPGSTFITACDAIDDDCDGDMDESRTPCP